MTSLRDMLRIMTAPKVLVFGVPHQVQGEKFHASFDDECYRDTLEQLVAVNQVDFIFEEAGGRVPSHAGILAATNDSVGYEDVDPPREEREKYGLSKNTGEGYVVDLWQDPPCTPRLEYIDRQDAREEFWLSRIREKKFSSALVICGAAHCLSVSFRLRNAGYVVDRCIQYLPHEKLCGHAANMQRPQEI
jgi:hypothetical protein